MFSKNFNTIIISIILSIVISCGNFKKSQFELPSLFSDGMVLQRDTLVTFLGKYIPNQKINISCSWGFDTITFSDHKGNWKTHLKTNSALKGQTISSSYKPAILDNGLGIQVPPFIETGAEIVVDTRNLEYIKKI